MTSTKWEIDSPFSIIKLQSREAVYSAENSQQLLGVMLTSKGARMSCKQHFLLFNYDLCRTFSGLMSLH